MKRVALLIAAVTVPALMGASVVSRAGTGEREPAPAMEPSPISGLQLPHGYRDWRLISVAHEAGDLNGLRAILGNDVAIEAYRKGTLPFPDGTIIARLAWKYVSSEENDKVFGRTQSFVAGPPSTACSSWSRTRRSTPDR